MMARLARARHRCNSRASLNRRGKSSHCGPTAVGIAAGAAARDLRPTIDIDRVGVLAALQPIRLIGRAGDDGSIAARVRVFPGHGETRFAAFERLHLRRIGALLVLIIHRSADAVADEPADCRPGEAGGDAFAGTATKLRSDKAARYRADERARILARSLAGLWSAAACCGGYCYERRSTCTNHVHIKPPPVIPNRPAIRVGVNRYRC